MNHFIGSWSVGKPMLRYPREVQYVLQQKVCHRYWPEFQGEAGTYGDFTVTQQTFDGDDRVGTCSEPVRLHGYNY